MDEKTVYVGGRMVPEDTLRKLEMSKREARSLKARDLRCPVCGYKIAEVYSDRMGHMSIKCGKCKFSGVINLAYFRSGRRSAAR